MLNHDQIVYFTPCLYRGKQQSNSTGLFEFNIGNEYQYDGMGWRPGNSTAQASKQYPIAIDKLLPSSR